MKASLSLVGNYMCKNPPIVIFDIVQKNNEKQTFKRYLFNTPPDIQRNLQFQFVKINGSETIMFTKFSHETISGFVNLILALYDYQKFYKFLNLKLYGTIKHWDYFQTAKFHLGQKVFGLSYTTWFFPQYHRLGITDTDLYDEIQKSDKFSSFVWRINWRIQNEPKQKINNSKEYMKEQNKYYEDDFMIIKPFFQKNPKKQMHNYADSPIQYLCIFKNPIKQNDKFTQNTNQAQVNAHRATLIITYQSVEQVIKILSRSDQVEGVNNELGLLDFIESNIKRSSNMQSQPKIQLQNLVHIIQSPELVHSQQFYQLYNILDGMCYPSQSPASHIFYGYGIKSSTTNIHHLLNTYHKGIRFYSICSKLVTCLPNITSNHFNYWNKIFDREFVNICQKIQQSDAIKNGSFLQVYKPIHKLRIFQSYCGQESIKKIEDKKDQRYSISPQLLAELKFPLFSIASEHRPTKQFINLYENKLAFEKYARKSVKRNAPKALLTTRGKQLKQFNPKVIFLGTNSKTPSDLRNVSGILIQMPQFNYESLILLDCGAGSYQQMMYHYAPQEFDKKLLSLKIIFLTHLHADHNLGILDLIKKRNDLLKRKNLSLEDNKVFIVLPFNALSWLHGYCKTVQNIYEGCQILLTQTLTKQKIDLKDDFFESQRCQLNINRGKLSPGKFFGSNSSTQAYQSSDYYQRYVRRFGSYEQYAKALPDDDVCILRQMINQHSYKQQFVKSLFNSMLQKLKLKQFKPSKVFHCPFSYGVIIQHNNGIKISYSGDCRPTPQFLQHAKNSTLLIHEATYETNKLQKALKRFHSTFGQAIQAGMTSKSEHVCLTHFTPAAFDRDRAETQQQNLYKPEVFDFYRKKTIIACDHLQFSLSELPQTVKASKIISHMGRNSIIEKNYNPFSLKYMLLQIKKEGQKVNQIDEDLID